MHFRFRHIVPALMAAVFTMVSCGGKPELKKEDVTFFSTSFYFEKEAAAWKSMDSAVVKKTVSNGKKESLEIPVTTINWERELSLFSQAEINKPALREKYTVETVNGVTTYRTDDKKMKVQWIMIYTRGTDTTEINIHTRTENFLSRSDYMLFYFPGKGYAIEGRQEPKFFGEERIFSITATLL